MQRRSFVTVIASLVGTVFGYLLGRGSPPAQAHAQGNGMMGGGMV